MNFPSLCRLTAVIALAALAGCASEAAARGPEDPEATPEDVVRADYEVFASRCSKCHALSRATDSGIDDDNYWEAYVARMRLQPGSGISHEDARIILRYLHVYSLEQRRKKADKARLQTPAPSPGPSATLAPNATLAPSATPSPGPSATPALGATPSPTPGANPGPAGAP